jgi:hypothetical protein
VSNPKVRFKLKGSKGTYQRVFVGLYTQDSRLSLGSDYYKDPLYSTPLAFDVITADEFEVPAAQRKYVPRSRKPDDTCVVEKGDVEKEKEKTQQPLAKQAPYNFGSTQLECFLEADTEYFIVPFLYVYRSIVLLPLFSCL